MGIMIPGMQGAEDSYCMLLYVSAIDIRDKGDTLSKEATFI